MMGRNTMVLNIFLTVSRRFSAALLPDSNPRISASVMDSRILLLDFSQSSAAFLAALADASRLSLLPISCTSFSRSSISF